ncbi:hypothetical protein H0H92_003531 [Tricholoma furcatifolium]|nr:hypothetical protein H0H92_003531 [Tricholoma furcatifolium]
MASVPPPTLLLPREEWPDADFDLPEDWDAELNIHTAKPTIRPPPDIDFDNDDDDDDEGSSTIKVNALSLPVSRKPPQPPIEEDFEDAFALPSDLTQLSLAPLSLSHRASKNSLEWGDRDQTSSSQSSDAYSSLGFADASPSSNSTASDPLSCPETDEDDDLDGLVLPSSLFESGQSGRQLNKILEMKKKAQITTTHVQVAAPDPEDDFESGLVFEDDADLSPSRLRLKSKQPLRPFQRSHTVPQQKQSVLRPPSRLNRAKSPLNPPPASARQLQKIRLSPSPPLRSASHSQTFQALSSVSPVPSPSPSFLSAKPGSLRGQKSYSGLKPPTPPATMRSLSRKASLSALIESSHAQASGSGSPAVPVSSKARYEEPTAASRAKSHKYSTSRIQDYKVPPTRPSTPSSNPAALRLTMPSQSRLKSRPALSGVFGAPATPTVPTPRATSPLLTRPPSTTLRRVPSTSQQPQQPQPAAPKFLRRPKRQQLFGDGTELDGIEDLPTDRDKEGRYRVQPKGHGSRVPSATSSSGDKGTIKKKRRDTLSSSTEAPPPIALAPATNTLKRTARIEFPPKANNPKPSSPKATKKKASATPSPLTRKKPTLIRNLGSTNGPKVVGEMKWNPLTLRWEGNDHVLRDFDSTVGTSTRPALITHLTGSSIGSPVGSFASGARIVGNMIFDPARMCWISTLSPEEDEPDVFANLADDEEEDAWESKGGTIRASSQQPSGSEISSLTSTSTVSSADSSTSSTHADTPSPARSHTRTISDSESERGSRASMIFDIDETFVESCRAAEERHRVEMKAWRSTLAAQDVFSAPDRSYLYEIRALATRKY